VLLYAAMSAFVKNGSLQFFWYCRQKNSSDRAKGGQKKMARARLPWVALLSLLSLLRLPNFARLAVGISAGSVNLSL
jgi:hypothetical protein